MKCIILADKRKRNDEYRTEEGLSIYLEHESNKVLLDAGMTDAFIYNSRLLNVSLDEIDTVVLSHGHYDHGDGLQYLSNKKLILHSNCFTRRYSKRRDYAYAGIFNTKEELSSKYQIKEMDHSYEIYPNIFYIGEVKRIYDVPSKNLPTVLLDMNHNIKMDDIHDDTGIVIKTDSGIVVIASCSHSGIDNIIEQAKQITSENRVLCVIGGFHLREVDEYTDQIIKYFKENHIQSTYMGHCTKDEVIDYFKEKLEGIVEVHTFYAGDVIEYK